MKIHNVRLGLACNSSSSHSLIFLSPQRTAEIPDYLVGLENPEEWTFKLNGAKQTLPIPDGNWEFGWEYFTASTEASKRQYIALTLLHNLSGSCTPEIARLVAQEWAGTRLHGEKPCGGENGYIDHESQIVLPVAWDSKGLDPEFTKQWVDYMMQEGLVIVGGNDNDDYTHALDYDTMARNAEIGLGRDGSNSGLVCRYDEKFKFWTLFNRTNGNKMRVSFDQPYDFRVERASTPELVDIKITDFCPYDCPFCAPAGTLVSTPDGDKPIETISVGDIVYHFDFGDGQVRTQRPIEVQETYERELEGDLIEIEPEEGKVLRLTPNHEVYTTNRGWICAGDIQEGDDVQIEDCLSSPSEMKVKAVRRVHHKGPVYNLGVGNTGTPEPNRNYFANGVLVHNCYMGSTQTGAHLQDYHNWVSVLKELKVFEVAIGGGEPTLHPKFLEILQSFRSNGIVPNFTTKNLNWLRDPKKWKPILETCGSFAFSVGSKEEVTELALLLDVIGAEPRSWFPRGNVTVQYVMGTTRSYDLRGIAQAAFKAGIKLTLLGYKYTGRGKEWKPEKYDDWIEHIVAASEGSYAKVNIDTTLAEQYEDQLKEEGVPGWLFHTNEGSFSMYIDAVTSRIGPSSYCPEEEMVDFKHGYPREEDADKLRTIFQTFHGWDAEPKSRVDLILGEY